MVKRGYILLFVTIVILVFAYSAIFASAVQTCNSNTQCPNGYFCSGEGFCEPRGCNSDDDCPSHQKCSTSRHACVDCSCGSGKTCINHVCVCSTDAGCTDGKQCVNHACVSRNPRCPSGNAAECGADYICINYECISTKLGAPCNSSQTCKAGLFCYNESASSPRKVCTTRIAVGGDCTGKADGCIEGAYCDHTSTNKCFKMLGQSCSSSAECGSNFCSGGTCKCDNNNDCWGLGEVCAYGSCGTKSCTSCRAATEKCDNQYCVPKTCTTDATCAGGYKCKDGTCLLLNTRPCGANEQCYSGLCSNGKCAETSYTPGSQQVGQTCGTGIDCASTVCLSGKCVCKQIYSVLGCPTDRYCLGPNNMACNGMKMDANSVCDYNVQCKSGKCVNGKCASLLDSGATCARDDECKTGRCIDGECSCNVNTDCKTAPKNKCAGNKCVVCTADSDCGTDKMCSGGQCVAKPCQKTADCQKATNVCYNGRCTDSTEHDRLISQIGYLVDTLKEKINAQPGSAGAKCSADADCNNGLRCGGFLWWKTCRSEQ